MNRTFVELSIFSQKWRELGFTDDDLLSLQTFLLDHPDAGPIIPGTGGIRKIRFAFRNQGKSGSARICYCDFSDYAIIYLITVCAKNQQENITPEQKNILKNLVKKLKNEASQKGVQPYGKFIRRAKSRFGRGDRF